LPDGASLLWKNFQPRDSDEDSIEKAHGAPVIAGSEATKQSILLSVAA
jgi:hypothetical protein